MTLLVRDEIDIIEKNICFHLNHGVDFIVAVDNGSIDGTTQVLQKYAQKGVLSYKIIKKHTKEQSKWVSTMARLAVKKYHATHLFHCDADEFWYPASGNLKNHLPQGNRVLLVPSVNYLPPTLTQRLALKRFIVTSPYTHPATRHNAESYRFFLFPQQPKVFTTSNFTCIAQGNHLVLDRPNIDYRPAADILIHHFPVRSFNQFRTKVINGGSSYEKNPVRDPDIGWHQKDWYRCYQANLLTDLYHSLCFLPSEKRLLLIKNILHQINIPRSIQFAPQIYRIKNLSASSSYFGHSLSLFVSPLTKIFDHYLPLT
jgi:glycosyltransferase involved in cell wall biosynthesis